MRDITRLDAIDLFPRVPPVLVQWIIGLAMTSFAIGLRLAIDLVFPGAAPYAVNVPAILIATLVGRMRAGMIALVLTSVFTWWAVVPLQFSFMFLIASDGPRTVVNILTSFLLVLLAEFGRHSLRDLVHEREARIGERDMLLREVDHRVKNNLAVLVSLLRLQQRETEHEEVNDALEKAAGRVHSLATAYENLRYDTANIAVVRLDEFLAQLCDALREALAIESHIDLVVDADSCPLSRDRASAVGLFVNETVTNAVKHAFAGRASGSIHIRLRGNHARATLIVADDGIGMRDSVRDGAQGHRYLDAFAAIARGQLDCASGPDGTRYTLVLDELP